MKMYEKDTKNERPICNNNLKQILNHKDEQGTAISLEKPQQHLENKKALPVRSDKYTKEISALIEVASKLSLKGKTLCCSFCRNNNETESVYKSHNRTDVSGTIICPILANHKCEVCGEKAHTRNYCELFQRQTKLKKIQKYAFNKNL